MDIKEGIKSTIWKVMLTQLDQKLELSDQAKVSITESKNAETKSSAGDKYETSRAMMQIELDKIDWQAAQLRQLRNVLKQINPKEIHTEAKLGSLIFTNQGNYFLSVGIGKVELEGIKYYGISLDAPIGKTLLNKKSGWQGIFLNKPLEIKAIQ